jgi:hypothetical protein
MPGAKGGPAFYFIALRRGSDHFGASAAGLKGLWPFTRQSPIASGPSRDTSQSAKIPTPSRPGVLLHAVNRTKARDREADPSGLLFVFGINRIRKKQGAAGITAAASSVCNGSPKSTVIQKSDIASTFYKS